jgi:tetratricopeptide (TPR) repeat protein
MSDTKATGRIRWMVGSIAGAAVAAYWNSRHGAFVLDDQQAIIENASLRHLWPIWGALHATTLNSTANGRPLLNLSLALNYAVSGTNPWSYHAANLLIHVLAGLVLFGLVRRTLELKSGKRKAKSGNPESDPDWNSALFAFCIALLWTVHPLQTEAVTYVVQRAESLMGLFYLLTLYCFVRCVELEADEGGRPFSLFAFRLSLFCSCLFGMATKEDMVSAPVMVLLYDRTFVSGSFREACRRHGRLLLGLAATWLLLGALVVTGGGNRGGTIGFGVGTPWWGYLLTQFQAIWTYLRLSFWPRPLVFDYGLIGISPVPELLAEIALVGGLLAVTVRGLWRRTAWGFLGAWFFLLLAPTSLVPGTTQMIVEHRMYLPLAAVIAAGMLIVDRMVFRPLPSALRVRLATFLLLACAVAGVVLTARRNRDYRSAIALWSDTAAKRPGTARVHASLATALLAAGRPADALPQFDEAARLDPDDVQTLDSEAAALDQLHRPADAIAAYERALRLRPEFARAHNDLGVVLAEQGRLPEAIAHYEFVLRLQPGNPAAHFNRGNALLQLGRAPEAAAEFAATLRAAPDYAEADCNLGQALAAMDRLPEAVARYEEALRLQPDFPECRYNLGNARMRLGQAPAAITEYEAALRLRPAYAEAESNLGIAVLATGDASGAILHYAAALRINPGYAAAEYNWGNALAQAGRVPEAVAHYEAALRLDPGHAEAEANLGNALFQTGRVAASLGHYQAALRLRPGNPRVHFNLGNALLQSGRAAEAAEEYAVALRLKPDFAEARAMLARLRP